MQKQKTKMKRKSVVNDAKTSKLCELNWTAPGVRLTVIRSAAATTAREQTKAKRAAAGQEGRERATSR
jgi:hypothetical protein